MSTRWIALFAMAAAALLWAPRALGQPSGALRPIQVKRIGPSPQLTFAADDFVNARVAEKLNGGLPQRIVTRVFAYVDGKGDPIAVTAMSCRIAYDLWEGVYRVQLQNEQSDRAFVVGDLRSAARACLDVHALGFLHADGFRANRGRRVYFAALLELNPLSSDTVQRIRRWLSKSGDGQLRGDAFFGSFVSVFVSRRMGSAEHSLAFRSESFAIPP